MTTTTNTTDPTTATSTTRMPLGTVVGVQGVGFSAQHGSRELAGLTAGCAVVLGLGVGASVSSVVELAVTWLLALALAAGAAVAAGRRVCRWQRERVEDRMDTAYAATVRQACAHQPVPVAAPDRLGGQRVGGAS